MVRGLKDEMYLKFKENFDELYGEISGKIYVENEDKEEFDDENKKNFLIIELLKIWKEQGIETAITQYNN